MPIDVHDGDPTDHGTILYLADALKTVTDFPTSATNPDAPTANASVLYQSVVEISATNSAVLNTWSPIDLLDPRRITYLFEQASDNLSTTGWDTEHSDAVIEDPGRDSVIVSLRAQNAVCKFSRATGQLVWILGPPENWGPQWQPYLLTPVGVPFAWQYGQHSPVFTPQGTLMLYDDGNYRASPFDPSVPDSSNYSRAVEYSIDEETMEVFQVWQYGSATVGDWFYTAFQGHAFGVVFVIKTEGKEVFRSPIIRGAAKASYAIDVTGVKTLELVVDKAGSGTGGNWGLWLAPTLSREPLTDTQERQ